jgi:hypothetical protein
MSDCEEYNELECDDDLVDDDDDEITCWCGAKGTYDELFDESGLDIGCGGTGWVDCHCGGDLCVCCHHGQEQECPGCDECQDEYDNEMDIDYDEEDYE